MPRRARPMMPTEARDIDCRIHQVDHLLPKAPGTAALTLLSIPVSTSGRRDSTNPPTAETDHQQREQREDRVVGQAGREEVALAFVEAVVGAHRVVEPSEPCPQPIQDSWFARLRSSSAPARDVSAGTRAGHTPGRPFLRRRPRPVPPRSASTASNSAGSASNSSTRALIGVTNSTTASAVSFFRSP